MTFQQFAYKNVSRNLHAYLAYFLSSAFSVMIFFTFAAFIFHPELVNTNIQKAVRNGMTAAEVIIFAFSFLFVLYSVSTFLKVRNNEFGTYMLLGMSKRQLNRLIFMENIFIGFLAIITGILVGVVFLKFFLLLSVKVLGIAGLSFYFPAKAILLSMTSFAILFLLISMMTTFFVRTNKIINLLKGSKKPKKEPKPSIILSLLAIMCLALGYFTAFTAKASNLTGLILPVILIVTVGTFLFFAQFSLLVIRLLKCKRSFYMKRINMLWISDLGYRIKDNGRMLFLVSIVSAVAFTSVATLYLWDNKIKEAILTDFPFAINYLPETDIASSVEQENIREIERALNEEQLAYEKVKATVIEQKINDKRAFYVMKLSEYNQIANLLRLKTINLNDNEGFLIPQFTQHESQNMERKWLSHKTLSLPDSSITVQLTGLGEKSLTPYGILGPTVVVSDSVFHRIESTGVKYAFYGYDISDWERTADIALKLKNNQNLQHDLFTVADRYQENKQISGLTLLIGFFIGAIFFTAAGSFLYFRFYADVAQEKEKYVSMAKIGLTQGEMKKAATVQMAVLFFIPYVLAFIHTAFALKPLQMLFASSIILPVAKVLLGFLLVQTLYFLVLRWRYVKNISRYMF